MAWGGGISYDAGDVIAVVPDDPDDDGFNLHDPIGLIVLAGLQVIVALTYAIASNI